MLLKLLSTTFRVGLLQGCCVNKKKLPIWVQKEGMESKVCLYLTAGTSSFGRTEPCRGHRAWLARLQLNPFHELVAVL